MSNTVYAWSQTSSGGLVYSTTNGSTWSTFLNPSPYDVGYFWMDQFNSGQNAVYIDTNGSGNPYYTTNTGSTWTAVSSVPSGAKVVACLPDGTLIAASAANFASCTAYYSTNGGSTWTSVSLPNQTSKMLFMNGSTNGTDCLFVRGSDGSIFMLGQDTTNTTVNVWKSTNEGSSWSRVYAGTSFPGPISGVSYKETSSNNVLMYLYSISAGGVGVLRSPNLGSTWGTVTVDNSKHGSYSGGQYAAAYPMYRTGNPGYMVNGDWLLSGFYFTDSFDDAALLFWESTDDGATWSAASPSTITIAPSQTPVNVYSFLWSDRNSTSWGCLAPNKNNGGVWTSTDSGSTWSSHTSSPWGTTGVNMRGLWCP
jgi:photosystem II stability/assembly factor-like uncharacterized protein